MTSLISVIIAKALLCIYLVIFTVLLGVIFIDVCFSWIDAIEKENKEKQDKRG